MSSDDDERSSADSEELAPASGASPKERGDGSAAPRAGAIRAASRMPIKAVTATPAGTSPQPDGGGDPGRTGWRSSVDRSARATAATDAAAQQPTRRGA